MLTWQSQAAQEIASEVRIDLTSTEQRHIGRAHSVNSEAFEAYLKGRYHWNKRSKDGLRKAEQYFQEAIQKDPNYAPAYAGLADTYILFANFNIAAPGRAYPRAKEMASKAIQIDGTLAEAHTSLATLKAIYDWDRSGAEQEFRRAIELNPSYATAHHWYAEDLLIRMGRQAEALAEIERARQLDPLSLQINAVEGRILSLSNQNDKAIEQGRRALDLDPGWSAGHWWLGLAYEQRRTLCGGNRRISESNFTQRRQLDLLDCLGPRLRCVRSKDRRRRNPSAAPEAPLVTAFDIALLHAALGHNAQAFLWLGKACDERDYWIGTLAVEPRFEPLRSDPRFGDLLHRLGLLQQ